MANTDMARLDSLSKAFSPSAPIDQKTLFAGRQAQLLEVLNAIGQKGQHAIMFGERGVGKTSLARVLATSQVMFEGNQILIASINCDATMDFSSMWHRLMREITFTQSRPSAGFTSAPNLVTNSAASMLPEKVTPDDLRMVLRQIGKSLFIIDELDRLEDEKAATLLADTIKCLSDHAVDTTLLLVGVADSVDALVGEHHSVERALAQVRMPRMSPPELSEIISRGLAVAAMTIDDDAKRRIVQLSQGLPHYTHLLAQAAAQRAVWNNRVKVELTDVRSAIDSALQKAQQSTISKYHEATASPRENMYQQVLLACALAPPDSLGYFAAVDVREPLSKIMGRRFEIPAFSQHLNAFCELNRGSVLQRTGSTRRYRFRFENPLMQPFVIMDGLKKGLIDETSI